MMRALVIAMLTWALAGPAVWAQGTGGEPGAGVADRLRAVIDRVEIQDATARAALQWWSQTTGIAVEVNWDQMAVYGVDPDRPVTVRLTSVTAARALGVIAEHIGSEFAELIIEVTPWDVRVMTKQQANRHAVLRVYDVADLMIRPVNGYRDAPTFDLAAALGGDGDGGGDGGGGVDLFADEDDEPRDRADVLSPGESLAQLVRDSIEPAIWQAHGGTFASVRYFRGRLIVRAPLYVHHQIGTPVTARPQRVNPDYEDAPHRDADRSTRPSRTGVAGTSPPSRVSGTY